MRLQMGEQVQDDGLVLLMPGQGRYQLRGMRVVHHHQELLVSAGEEVPRTTTALVDFFRRFFEKGVFGRDERGGYISLDHVHAAHSALARPHVQEPHRLQPLRPPRPVPVVAPPSGRR
ncbi:hypothetical protein ACFCX0_24520 [Streptomyces sp. NPDC056352]|uniref:hypothetical protein n=1 Tax=Streptomyces sp. NPDC056352 TaxID=3345791 RepID=UPI0035DC8F72